MDKTQKMILSELSRRIDSLEALTLTFSAMTKTLADRGNTTLVSIANTYLGVTMYNLAEYHILKSAVSEASVDSKLVKTCMGNALILNPDVEIRNKYNICIIHTERIKDDYFEGSINLMRPFEFFVEETPSGRALLEKIRYHIRTAPEGEQIRYKIRGR